MLSGTNVPPGATVARLARDGLANPFSSLSTGTDTSTPPVTITNDSVITWLWETNYWLQSLTNGGGTVTGAEIWVRSGSNATVEAITNLFYYFTNWSGDVELPNTNDAVYDVTMDQPRTLTANFDVRLAPMLTPYLWLAGKYPDTNDFDSAELDDTDGDKMKTWEEYRAGTDPTNPASLLKVTDLVILTNRNAFSWSGVVGRAYSVYRSTNLLYVWPPAPLTSGVSVGTDGPVRFHDPDFTNGPLYYRVEVE